MIFDHNKYKLPKTDNFKEALKRFDTIVMLEFNIPASDVKRKLEKHFGPPFVKYVMDRNKHTPRSKPIKNWYASWHMHGKFFLTNKEEIILELMMLENDFNR